MQSDSEVSKQQEEDEVASSVLKKREADKLRSRQIRADKKLH